MESQAGVWDGRSWALEEKKWVKWNRSSMVWPGFILLRCCRISQGLGDPKRADLEPLFGGSFPSPSSTGCSLWVIPAPGTNPEGSRVHWLCCSWDHLFYLDFHSWKENETFPCSFCLSLWYHTEFLLFSLCLALKQWGWNRKGFFFLFSQPHPLASPRAVEASPGSSPSHFQPVHRTKGCWTNKPLCWGASPEFVSLEFKLIYLPLCPGLCSQVQINPGHVSLVCPRIHVRQDICRVRD